MLICRGREQLKPIYDNVSGTSKKELSQFGHQIYNVFSNIVNYFWKGVIGSDPTCALGVNITDYLEEIEKFTS